MRSPRPGDRTPPARRAGTYAGVLRGVGVAAVRQGEELSGRYGGVVTAWGRIDPGALSIAALVCALIQVVSAP